MVTRIPPHRRKVSLSPHAGAPETVQRLEIPGDGPDLVEAAVAVPVDEPAVQLVALGLLTPEDALDHVPLPSLGQDHVQPVLRNGLEISGQGSVVGGGLAGPRYLYHGQVALHIAGGLVPCDHQDADEVQFGSGVYRGSAPVTLHLTRAWILPHKIHYRVNQECGFGAMSQAVTYTIVRSSLVFDHCRVREITIKKRIRLGVAWLGGITQQPPIHEKI